MQFTDHALAQLAHDYGRFRGLGLALAVAVALAESGGDSAAVNVTGNHPPSRDRGLWQINSYYHPEVSDDAAFDPASCAQAAYRISRSGTDWTPWSTFTSGSYTRFLPRARLVATQVELPSAYALHRQLQLGSVGADVAAVQHRIGCTADGTFGPVTQGMVKAYQQDNPPLAVDGIVGQHTCEALGWHWQPVSA